MNDGIRTVSYVAGGSVIINATPEDLAAQAPRQARYWSLFAEERDALPTDLSRNDAENAARRLALSRMDAEGLRVDPLPAPQKPKPYVAPKLRFSLSALKRPAIRSTADAAAFASNFVAAVANK